jgi:ABC-type multidrug transport system fused ATPase/permease subunit
MLGKVAEQAEAQNDSETYGVNGADGWAELINPTLLMVISAFLIYSQLESTGSTAALMRLVDSSIDSINRIDSTPVMDIDGENLNPKNFDIAMKDVSFFYDSRKILDHINLKILEKSTTAVVGPSGGGKSTLCSLILRFWDVDEGSVQIGGEDVRSYTLDSLLKNISIVFQKVYLFDDTIANNIRDTSSPWDKNSHKSDKTMSAKIVMRASWRCDWALRR